MKIRLVETNYWYDEDGYKLAPISDILEVTEEEYDTLKYLYQVEVLKDKDWFVEQALKERKRQEKLREEYEKRAKLNEEKRAATAQARKLKQLEKLKKELGVEDSIK